MCTEQIFGKRNDYSTHDALQISSSNFKHLSAFSNVIFFIITVFLYG